MKPFLIKTSAPFCGTDQYYAAYAENEDTLLDWLYSNWFDEECNNLFNEYSYFLEDEWEVEWNETFEEYANKEEFDEVKYEDWCTNCSLEVSELENEEDFNDYASSDTGLEIIYDERK